MRKRIFYILFAIIVSFKAYSKDYTFYYRQTQLAEECLLNEEFKMALDHYDSAFNNYDFKFARDCYIAAQTASILKNDKSIYQYLSYCIQDGIKFNCLFNGNRLLQQFKSSTYFKKLYSQQDSLWKQYLKRIDAKLNLELTKRYIKEQVAKNSGGEMYYRTVEDNVWWIENKLIENKYPGEKLAGIKNSILVTTISAPSANDTCEFSSDMANVSLRHFNYGYDLLRNKLIKAMYEGQINPRELVLIFIFNKGRICTYRRDRPAYIKEFIENTADSSVVFNLLFEKGKTDVATANMYRDKWFIPRIGMKLTTEQLLKKYGLSTMIGDWCGY